MDPKLLSVDADIALEAQRRLVRSLLDIGKSLGFKVVAEGVGTMEQAHILRELGCDMVQGYAFARPMPADALARLLRTQHWLKAL